MGIRFSDIWPSGEKSQRIPVFEMGGVARFGEHAIWQTPVETDRRGNPECWLCDLGSKKQIDELVAVVQMQPGMNMRIGHKGNTHGILIYDRNGRMLEFAEFADDGQGLKYPHHYEHISIDPAKGRHDIQIVTVN